MKPIYALFRGLCKVIYRYYFGWEIYGKERVPPHGRAILTSNHASFLDPPLIGSATDRECNYLGRESLFRYPGVGWLLRQVNSVPLDRDGGGPAGLKTIIDRLNQDQAIVLFPEGTRTRDGSIQSARSGIGFIVIKSGAPVVPIRVWGTFEAFNRFHKFPRRHKLKITFGDPLNFEDLRAEAKTADKARLKQIYQEIADQIMAAISQLQPRP